MSRKMESTEEFRAMLKRQVAKNGIEWLFDVAASYVACAHSEAAGARWWRDEYWRLHAKIEGHWAYRFPRWLHGSWRRFRRWVRETT